MSCEKYVHLSTHCHNQLTEPNILFHFKNSLPFCSQSIPNLRPWQPPMVFYYYSLSLAHFRISYKLDHTECSIFSFIQHNASYTYPCCRIYCLLLCIARSMPVHRQNFSFIHRQIVIDHSHVAQHLSFDFRLLEVRFKKFYIQIL